MDKERIKRAVERTRGSDPYKNWTIGITNEHYRRKGEHRNPPNWDWWPADSEKVARNVEKHFVEKGMKGDTGGGDNPRYVYVFKKSPYFLTKVSCARAKSI